MRIVADTNVIVSAFLWGGVPRQILDAAEAQRIELFTSPALITELEDVLSRGKFAAQLSRTRFTPAYLLARYTQLATLIAPAEISVSELRDPDDAAVLACTRSAPIRTSPFFRLRTGSGVSLPEHVGQPDRRSRSS